MSKIAGIDLGTTFSAISHLNAMGRPDVPAGNVIEEFVASLGQPTRLSAVGVHEEQFEEVAQHAMHDRYIHTNPRPITSPEDVLQILALAR